MVSYPKKGRFMANRALFSEHLCKYSQSHLYIFRFPSTGQSHWSFSMSPRGLKAGLLFLTHTHTHMHMDTKRLTHTHRGTCVVFQAHVSHSRGTVPPDSGNRFDKPPLSSKQTHTHVHTHTLFTSLRLVVFEEQKSSLSPLYAPAGFSMAWLAYHPAPRRLVHVGNLPASPSRSLTYIWTHTNTVTHIDGFSGHTSTTSTASVIFLARG